MDTEVGVYALDADRLSGAPRLAGREIVDDDGPLAPLFEDPRSVTASTRRLTLYAITAPRDRRPRGRGGALHGVAITRRIACRATRVRVPQAGPHQRWSRRLRMKNWPQLGASQYASAGR